MLTKRESSQPLPSVLARLMGLDEMPAQQPVQKKPRVLSENYLRRVSSIGVREKCSEQQSFKFSVENQDECKNVLQVSETLRRRKRHSTPVAYREMHVASSDIHSSLQLGHIAILKSRLDSDCRDINNCRKFRRKTESGYLNTPKKVWNGLGVYSSGELCIDDINELQRSVPFSRIIATKPSLGKADIAARCFSLSSKSDGVSHSGGGKKNEILISPSRNLYVEKKERKSMPSGIGPARPRFRFLKGRTKILGHGISSMSTVEPRPELSASNHSGEESELTMPLSLTLSGRRKRQVNCSGGSDMTRETKKQISERWTTTKSFQQVELPGSWMNEFVRGLPRSRSLLPCFDAVGSPNCKTRQESLENGGNMRDLESIDMIKNESGKQDCYKKYGLECERSDSSNKKSQASPYMVAENNLSIGDYFVQDEQENQLKGGLTDQISAVSQTSNQNSQTMQHAWMKQKGHKNDVREDDLAESSSILPKSSTKSSLSISKEVDTKIQTLENCFSNDEKHQSESSNSIFSLREEDSSFQIQYASGCKEISNGTFDEESVSSHWSSTDPGSPISSFGEGYQPSPNSVLDRFCQKEISSSSNCFKSVNASLHELHMQLELLKAETSEAYSDGSSMVVSSDDDNGDGSANGSEENQSLSRPFNIEESRDFSYLVDVLAEAGFQNRKLSGNSDTLHSQENPISYSVFENLEKKYGEQISWKKTERRLLFDRINTGLVDILQPSKGALTWTKPVARRFILSQGDAMIEEELWMLLASQEKELGKDSEKILGKDDGWMELGDDIQVIGREIENSLIDELVADVSSEIIC